MEAVPQDLLGLLQGRVVESLVSWIVVALQVMNACLEEFWLCASFSFAFPDPFKLFALRDQIFFSREQFSVLSYLVPLSSKPENIT